MDELLFFESHHFQWAAVFLLPLTVTLLTVYLMYRSVPYDRRQKYQGLRCKPGKPIASLITHDSIRLEWTEPGKGANSVTAYIVFYNCKDTEWKWKQLQKTDTCRNKIIVPNLLPNTTYYFKVRPEYKDGVGEVSDISESITTKLGLLNGQLRIKNLKLVVNEVWKARDKWFHIGIELQMEESDLKAIQYAKKDAGDCITEMLSVWLRGGKATWKALISALSNTTVHHVGLADSIYGRLVSDPDPDPDPETPACSANTGGIGFKCPTESGCSIEQHLGGECVKFASVSEPAFPYLDTKNLTGKEKVILKSKLTNESQAIMKRFSNLVNDFTDSLNNQNVRSDAVARTVNSIAPCESSTCGVRSLDLMKDDTVHKVVGHLLESSYMSFFNCHIVDCLIERYGTDKDKEKLDTYKKDFKEFCTRSVFEVPCSAFGPKPRDGEALGFKVTKEMSKCLQHSYRSSTRDSSFSGHEWPDSVRKSSINLDLSLDDTLTVLAKVAKVLNVSECDIVFLNASKGCVELTCSAPKVLMSTVKQYLDMKALQDAESTSKISTDFIDLEDEGIYVLCGPPGKPCSFQVTHTSISICWKKPEYRGFHPLRFYYVYYRLVGNPKEEWIRTQTTNSKEEIDLHNLCKGPFTFIVQAVSDIGAGMKSEESDPMTLLGSPFLEKGRDSDNDCKDKLGKLTAVNITHESVELQWIKPEMNHNSFVSYTIFYHSANDSPDVWIEQETVAIPTGPSDVVHCIVSHLSEKTDYIFKLLLTSIVGTDLESDVSDPITTKMIVPSKPGKPRALSISHDSIELEWIKPEKGAHNVLSYCIFFHKDVDLPNQWTEQKNVTSVNRICISQLSDNCTYYFKVQAICEGSESFESDISEPIRTKMLLPSKPGKPKATSVTHNSIELEWSKPDEGAHNVFSYIVFYHSSKQHSNQCKTLKTTDERALLTCLSEKTTYSFEVQPVCEAGVGPKSAVSDHIKTKEIIPSKPGTPEAMDITHDSIKLKWTEPEHGAHNITSYVILYQSTEDPTDKWMEQETTKLTESVLHLSEKTCYCFKIRPKCESGYGFESNVSEPILTKIEAPSKPGKPRALNVTNNSIEIEWSKPERGSHNVLSYNIYYHSSKQPSNRCLKVKANEERTLVSKLFEKTIYYFKVQPVSEAGIGPKSRVSEPIHTKMVIPGKPGKPTASNVTHNSLELEWTKPERGANNIISYSILYYHISGHWKEQRSTKEHALISQLLEKTEYRFKVRPNCEVDHESESDISEPIITKMIIPSEPGKPEAVTITCSSIEVNWTKPEHGAQNITSYTVLYRSSTDPPNLWMEQKTTDEGMLVSSLLDNRIYYFKIQPECEDICGLVSDISEPIKTKILWPSKPGKPKATSVTHNSIELEWSKPDEGAHNVSSYTVFYHSSKQRSKQCSTIKGITSERFLVRNLSEKTTYSFKVQPVCEAGVGPKSLVSDHIKTKEVIPSKPGTPEAMDITHDSIKLKWTEPEHGAHNITSYVILYQSTEDPTDKWMEQETTKLTESVLHLSEKTCYCFKIRPKCESGYGFEGNVSEPIRTKIEAPSKPGKPRALNVTDSSIEIEWSKPERGSHNVLSYNIYYHSSKQPSNRCLKVKANEERTLVSKLFEKTMYYFKIQPVSEAGIGPKSRISEPIHTKMVIPSKPGIPEPIDVTHDTIKLKWSKPECGAHNVKSYTVFYRLANDQWKEQEAVEENILLTNLLDSTTYYVKIQSNCETGRGSGSDESKPIKTKILIPSKPGKPRPLEITYRNVELEWSKPEKGAHNVTSYIISYLNSKFSDDWTKLPGATTIERALVSCLFEKTSYYFKIQPECVIGCGPESDISDLITTKMIVPSKPGKPTAKNIAHNSIDLEWSTPKDGAHNVISYTIYYYSSNDPNRELKHVSEGSIPSAHVSQLLQNTAYFFQNPART